MIQIKDRLVSRFEDDEVASPDYIEEHNRQVLASYQSQLTLIEEHANQEIAASEGAYGHRQVFELVQNAADAVRGSSDGRVHLVLTDSALYCANTGMPLTVGGLNAILHSFLSRKQEAEIGRYGLGFKSVLGVSDSPEFYSTGVSFCFDPIWAAKLISEQTGYREQTPKLRLAKVIGEPRLDSDPVLQELLSWSVSVVKLPFRDDRHEWLEAHVNQFPGEFLLFCPDVKDLILEDRTRLPGPIMIHRYSRSGENPVKVFVNDRPTEWRVFSTDVKPSPAARADGGYFAGRESVTLTWAVPAQGGFSDGQFWAFFPLEKEKMSLKGIVNAGWKLNDDRQNILDGLFNDELLDSAAALALAQLPILYDEVDPGKLLEILPARLDERVGADLRLTKRFYEIARNYPTLPDCHQNLRSAHELRIPPKNLPETAIKLWGECPFQPTGWAHPSTVVTTTRSARVDQLMDSAQRRESISTWLEALLGNDDIKIAAGNLGISEFEAIKICSSFALKAAAAVFANKTASIDIQEEVRRSRILLTEKKELVDLERNKVFLPAEIGQTYSGINIVHPDLLLDTSLQSTFEELGVSEVDATSELQSLLSSGPMQKLSDRDWERLWNLAAKIESNDETAGRTASIIRQYCTKHAPQQVVRVKTIGGHFHALGKTLLPGAIVSGDQENRNVSIDTDFHEAHTQLLIDLGALQSPVEGGGSKKEDWFFEYRQDAIEAFMKAKPSNSRRPGDDKLDFQETKFTGPIEPLIQLSGEGRSRFTNALLSAKEIGNKWNLRHISSSSYPVVPIDSPALWAAKRYGRFNTTQGVRQHSEIVGSELARWDKFLPVADLSTDIENLLDLPQSPQEIKSSIIERALEQVVEVTSPFLIGAFYAFISDSCVSLPSKIWCRLGETSEWHSPQKVIAVVAESINDSVIKIIKGLEEPYLILEDKNDAKKLIKEWKLKPVETSVVFEIRAVPSGPATPLIDAFSGLGYALESDQTNFSLIPCSTLRREVITDQGVKSEARSFIVDKGQFFYTDSLNDQELLETIAEELDLELSAYEIEDILGSKASEEKQQVFRRIREASGYADKLLMCVGGESLKKWLSNSLLKVAISGNKRLTDQRVAELFLAVHGVESLMRIKDDLASRGFDVPLQWAGSHKARRFVKDLGFSPEYAGFESSDRKASIDIEGPPVLPPLHSFQEKATQRIKSLLLSGGKNRRGLLSLPTGAGKTRVAVEAIIKTIRDDKFPGPVLWIAQSDELCEQAVQSWDEVWRAVGSQTPLRLNRLWASNEADEWIEGPQVVVATMQKLQHTVADPDYDWLKNCSALIIDEAHLSTTPGYTAILEWAGASRKSSRCPVLGLTATPFRGGEQETHRLAYRYDSNRLDEGILGDDPYRTLQTMGVLADVRHRLLDGADVQLDNRELKELEKTKRLSPSVVERLGDNKTRNDLIISTIKSLPSDWPVLLFAISVDNAKAIAAMLATDGITSAAISSETTPGARRHYIDRFRNGSIRVLCNYGVLTTGFDAPAVRAIIVARPTFSPVIYQQMIGRGLRGPLNGGKEECLIINVKDNFDQFGEKLAFTEFEYLWSEE